MAATGDVTVAQDGAQGNVKLHPYLVTLVRWCVSCLWSTASVLIHRLTITPLHAITGPNSQTKSKVLKRAAGRDHLDPDPKVNCQVLHQPEKHQFDVIFVHGLYGSLGNTWRQGEWRQKYTTSPKKVTLRDHSKNKICHCEKNSPVILHNDNRNNDNYINDNDIINNQNNDIEYINITDINTVTYKNLKQNLYNNIKTEQCYNNNIINQIEITSNYDTQAKFVRDLFEKETNCDNICETEFNINKYNDKKYTINDKSRQYNDNGYNDNEYNGFNGTEINDKIRQYNENGYKESDYNAINDKLGQYNDSEYNDNEYNGFNGTAINDKIRQYNETGYKDSDYNGYNGNTINDKMRQYNDNEYNDNQYNDSDNGFNDNECKCLKKCEIGCGCVCDECYSTCWPKDWIKTDFPDARVISINYTSDPYLWRPLWIKENKRLTLHERARQMIDQLLDLGVGDKPIIWVGHSKGGLFIKQIYCEAYEAYIKTKENIIINDNLNNGTDNLNGNNDVSVNDKIMDNGLTEDRVLDENMCLEDSKNEERCINLWSRSVGFMFYSVPHRGSPLADIKTPLTARSVELIEITKDCDLVLELQCRWLTAVRHAAPLVRGFVETCRTLMSVLWLRIVSVHSADAGVGTLYGVSVDHREICKPSSRNCFLYTELVTLIRDALNNCNC